MNRTNKSLRYETYFTCKKTITALLLKLDYEATEKLITI